MAKGVSTTKVGAFIVGALALIVICALLFGSGRFFHARQEFVCFFRGSLNGLKVGAPVKFRGVQIGTVTAIRIRVSAQPRVTETDVKEAALPVFIELDQDQIQALGGEGSLASDELVKAFIARGLRAQLATESLLTGLLYVDLDFHPGTQPTFILPPGSGYREIPTVPTSLQQLQEAAMRALSRLDNVDFAALINSLTDAAKATRSFVGSQELKETIVQMKDTVASLKKTADSIGKASDHLDAHLDPMIESLRKTSDQATLTLASAKATLADIDGALDPSSPIGYKLLRTLDNLSEASKAVSTLADYLHRNPSALVRGRADSVSAQ
jgi:phospholipid/cholesterol/gamma-HCH transport system substrate-binding protein